MESAFARKVIHTEIVEKYFARTQRFSLLLVVVVYGILGGIFAVFSVNELTGRLSKSMARFSLSLLQVNFCTVLWQTKPFERLMVLEQRGIVKY